MTAAAAAGKWWAAYRLLSRSSVRSSFGESQALESEDNRAARLILFLPVIFAGAMLLCAAIGFAVTELGESHLEAQQHDALRRALDEVRPAAGDIEEVDEALLRQVEHRAGLKELRFDTDPADNSGRALQSLHDGRGRIIGWFSWAADNALVRAMNRLWALLAVIGFAFGVVGCLAMRASRHLLRSLDRKAEAARKLVGHDDLTGLPNQRTMIERLGDALVRAVPASSCLR